MLFRSLVRSYAARYDGAGKLAWEKPLGTCGTDVATSASAGVAVDADGGVIVTGCFWGPMIFGTGEVNETTLSATSGSFVTRFGRDGALDWAREMVGRSNAYAVVVDGNRTFVVGGFSDSVTFGPGEVGETTLTGRDAGYLARFDQTGALVWAVRLESGAGGGEWDAGRGLALTSDGGVVVTGELGDRKSVV